MTAAKFSLDDYVDVAQRIREFYERHPDGRLTTGTPPRVVDVGGKPYVWYHARAYRTPDDPLPGDGWAAEPVPGPTPYTKDSELMNAETAAWGRAIVALGFATKKIASAEEVRNRAPAAEKKYRGGEQFRAPTPRVTGPDAEANELCGELLGLAERLGARESAEKSVKANLERNDLSAHKAWLKRQIVTARKNIETMLQEAPAS